MKSSGPLESNRAERNGTAAGSFCFFDRLASQASYYLSISIHFTIK